MYINPKFRFQKLSEQKWVAINLNTSEPESEAFILKEEVINRLSLSTFNLIDANTLNILIEKKILLPGEGPNYKFNFNSPILRSASFEITGRCNFNCVHCYIKDNRALNDLNFYEAQTIIDKIADGGCIFIQLTGGEVLLRKDFGSIYEYCRQKGLIVRISTNGSLLNPQIVNSFKNDPPSRIAVSCYGGDKKSFESTTGVAGSYEAFLNGVALLKEAGIRIRMNIIVLKENVGSMDAAVAFAKQNGFPFHCFSKISPTLGGSCAPKTHQISFREMEKTFMHNKSKGDFCENKGKSECNAGRKSFHIDASGRMFICKMYRNKGFDLLKGKLEAGKERLNDVLASIDTGRVQCKKCDVKVFCQFCEVQIQQENDLDSICNFVRLKARIFQGGESNAN